MNGSRSSVICLIRGPIMLIALGGLFALDQLTPYGLYSFWRTWPILVILFGVLKLMERISAGPSGARQNVPPGGAL